MGTQTPSQAFQVRLQLTPNHTTCVSRENVFAGLYPICKQPKSKKHQYPFEGPMQSLKLRLRLFAIKYLVEHLQQWPFCEGKKKAIVVNVQELYYTSVVLDNLPTVDLLM